MIGLSSDSFENRKDSAFRSRESTKVIGEPSASIGPRRYRIVSSFIYRLVVSRSDGRTAFVGGESLYDVGDFEFLISR